MASLEQLKRENERLRNQIKSKQEIMEMGRLRAGLIKEQKSLRRHLKFGGLGLSEKSKTNLKNIGKRIGVGLMNQARRMAEAEREQQKISQAKSRPKRRGRR